MVTHVNLSYNVFSRLQIFVDTAPIVVIHCTVKPILRDHGHKRPPVLKDHTFFAEGPTF